MCAFSLEVIAAAKDVLLGFAALSTAAIAFIGLKSWRRELKGRAEFEAARDLIRVTYKLRDEIQSCRSPFVSGHEFPESYRDSYGKKSQKEEADGWRHVYNARWKTVGVVIQEFDAQSLEAEALWGEDVRSLTNTLRQCANKLYVAIEMLISNYEDGGETFGTDRKLGQKIRADVSASVGTEGNALSLDIEMAINGIEQKIRPHLNRG